ncbi:MAG: hypothetical protein QME49_08730 [bacterium]|nr:hypothetical protein [bacterium]
MKKCYDVRGCPASHYLRCAAYASGKDCWEVPDIPCCKRNDKERCKECNIYQGVFGTVKKEF